jgi:phosphatidylglycerophosphate synthase
VNRRLARFAAAAAYAAGWSANAVTAASALLSLVAIVLMVSVPPDPVLGIFVGVFLAAGYVLDSADGQVARLGRTGSPAGEWLDHVVDSVRTPAIHLAVFVGLALHGGAGSGPLTLGIPGLDAMRPGEWALLVALLYCLVSVGQFMSQILAEQLSGAAVPSSSSAGVRQSVLLIPTDMGTLCWIFALWGLPEVFIWAYLAMFLLNAAHTLISMRRKYQKLRRPAVQRPGGGEFTRRAA